MSINLNLHLSSEPALFTVSDLANHPGALFKSTLCCDYFLVASEGAMSKYSNWRGVAVFSGGNFMGFTDFKTFECIHAATKFHLVRRHNNLALTPSTT